MNKFKLKCFIKNFLSLINYKDSDTTATTMIPKSSILQKESSKLIQKDKSLNLSSIEDSIIVHKNMSIRFLSNPKKEIKGFSFNNFLLSKNLSENNCLENDSEIKEKKQKNFPMLLSPICFHNIY